MDTTSVSSVQIIKVRICSARSSTGSRVSLKIGITVAMLTVTLGTIVGSISGYYGGRVDEVIMRICDIFFAVPGLILAMAFRDCDVGHDESDDAAVVGDSDSDNIPLDGLQG